jgi:hypothetical protein
MYLPNQIVEYRGSYGRVMYHDCKKHVVHVLFKENANTWIIKQCDDLFCKTFIMFLWGVENAFCIRNRMRVNTPHLAPLKIAVPDHFIEL